MKHVDLVVFWLDLGLEAWVIFLKFKEFLGLDSSWASLFWESFNLSTQDNDLEGKLVGKLSLFFKLLFHSFVVSFINLYVSNQTHDMVLR